MALIKRYESVCFRVKMSFQRSKFRVEGEVELGGSGASIRWLIILFLVFLVHILSVGNCSLQVCALYIVLGTVFLFLGKSLMKDTLLR